MVIKTVIILEQKLKHRDYKKLIVSLSGAEELLERRINANDKKSTFAFVEKILQSMSKLFGNVEFSRKELALAIYRITDDAPLGKIHFIVDESIITTPMLDNKNLFDHRTNFNIKVVGDYLPYTDEPL